MDEIAFASQEPETVELETPSARVPSFRDPVRIVKKLIADACAIDASVVSEQGHLMAYGLDSVRAIDLLVSLEDEFGVAISERDAARMKTVADVIRCVDLQCARR